MNWKKKKVLVTGACGFIGSHLVEQLISLGAEVKALVLYDSRGRYGWMDDVAPDLKREVEIIQGDIRDAEMMVRITDKESYIFHLAALIGIPYSYHAPRSYLETNITGTLNMLEAARQKSASRILVTSTSEVYGSAVKVPISESHPLQAQSPYSASKIAAEKMAFSYWCSFNLPVTIARPFNTYGPRQSGRAVIPTILMQAAAGKAEICLGDPLTTRDFNYVTDTARGMIKLAESSGAIGNIVNIGTGTEISIKDTVRVAAEVCGHQLRIKKEKGRIRPANSEVRRLCADSRLIRKITGWKPLIDFKKGMALTADWFNNRKSDYDAGRYYI